MSSKRIEVLDILESGPKESTVIKTTIFEDSIKTNVLTLEELSNF